MPEPLLVGPFVAGYLALQTYARRSSAVSPAALAARKAASAVVDFGEQSQSLFGEKAAAISQLSALFNEYGEPNWDGDAAHALDPSAFFIAEAFIRALPNDIPLPGLAPEPDGSVSLDWIQSKNRVFTISVSSSPRLPYAWLDGADKGHAVASFDEEAIPPRILQGIRNIVGHGNAIIRSF